MHIHLIWPEANNLPTGNRETALQYIAVFKALGHEVTTRPGNFENIKSADSGSKLAGSIDVGTGQDPECPFPRCDLLVVLHGLRCRNELIAYRKQVPTGRILLVLTGTDLYAEEDIMPELEDSLAMADQVVVLQEQAAWRVPLAYRDKVNVIYQSVKFMPKRSQLRKYEFVISVVGHLREEKDPFRTAEASRKLPESSRIQVQHVGAILDAAFEAQVDREAEQNSRYTYRGALDPEKTRQVIADSDLLVHTSLVEGGSRVVGEAVVAGTPVLATRIDAHLSIFGAGYPGLFEVGDTEGLMELLCKAESDSAFYHDLVDRCGQVVGQFDPEIENAAWEKLLDSVQK